MKKLGVVNSVLAGKTVDFAHGTKSAINKQVMSQRLHATELGFTNDEALLRNSRELNQKVTI